MVGPKKTRSRFPTRDEIIEYIESASGKVTKRDIANAFHIKGEDRVRLKKILHSLVAEGELARDPGKALRPAGRLPHVLVVEITGVDEYGDLMARPQKWEKPEPPPRIYLSERRRKAPALGKGEAALVRLSPEEDRDGLYYAARIIKVLKGAPRTFIGVYHDTAEGGQIVPADKKTRKVFAVDRETARDISDNSLVLASTSARGGRTFRPVARVLENLGDLSQPKSISLIAIHHHDIPYQFPAEVLREAERVKPPALKSRVDLRKLPFITIDPADARDHAGWHHAGFTHQVNDRGILLHGRGGLIVVGIHHGLISISDRRFVIAVGWIKFHFADQGISHQRRVMGNAPGVFMFRFRTPLRS